MMERTLTIQVQPAIDICKLCRDYKTVHAVNQITLQVPPGTIFGLLGPNGAGKSTTIKMLTTLLPPTSGTAKIFGLDLIQYPSRVRENIGYVSQLLSADGDLTGYENLLLSAKLYGLDHSTREIQIKEVLQFMGLQEVADQMVNQYSGGMIRRLEIAAALVHKPKILFLDEPSVGLDPGARQVVWQHLKEWRKRFGTTIFMTTHDMDEADKMCDLVAIMHMGKIVAIDTPVALKLKISPEATLNDVFLHFTGTTLNEGGNYDQAKEVRRTIAHLD
jgi:ABC-2 type transport system ATP-binding protein